MIVGTFLQASILKKYTEEITQFITMPTPQQKLNIISARVRAILNVVPRLQGPKPVWAEWILGGLQEELVSAPER